MGNEISLLMALQRFREGSTHKKLKFMELNHESIHDKYIHWIFVHIILAKVQSIFCETVYSFGALLAVAVYPYYSRYMMDFSK